MLTKFGAPLAALFAAIELRGPFRLGGGMEPACFAIASCRNIASFCIVPIWGGACVKRSVNVPGNVIDIVDTPPRSSVCGNPGWPFGGIIFAEDMFVGPGGLKPVACWYETGCTP